LNNPTTTELPADLITTPYRKIDKQKALQLRKQGVSYPDIGKYFGVTHSAVILALRPFQDELENLDFYKSNRADVFAGLQFRLLNSLTPSDIKGMQPYQRIVGASILYDKERLELGQSSINLSVAETLQDMTKRQEHSDSIKHALLERIQALQGESGEQT